MVLSDPLGQVGWRWATGSAGVPARTEAHPPMRPPAPICSDRDDAGLVQKGGIRGCARGSSDGCGYMAFAGETPAVPVPDR